MSMFYLNTIGDPGSVSDAGETPAGTLWIHFSHYRFEKSATDHPILSGILIEIWVL